MRELLPVLFVGLVPIAVLALIVTGTAFSLVAWQPPILLTTEFGTANSGNGITAITSDQTGIYAAGFIGRSNVPYENVTPAYLFLNKYDLNGGIVWSRHFDNPYLSNVNGIATGPNGVYVAGFGNLSSFVRGFDLDGNQLWIIQFGSTKGDAMAIAATSTRVYIGGRNVTNYFLRDYDLSQNLLWASIFGDGANRISLYAGTTGVYVFEAETPSTPVLSASSLIRRYDLNGSLVWSQVCSCDAMGLTGDSSGIYGAGGVQTGFGTTNGFLAKYGFDGSQLWNSSFGAPGSDSVTVVSVSVDSSGVYGAAGTTGATYFVIRYDARGNRVWTVRVSSWHEGTVITVQSSGIFLGGQAGSNQLAFMTLMSKSSSLIFFGINPPFSFVVFAALVGVVAVSLLLLRREVRKRRRPASTSQVLRSKGIPTDLWTQPL